MKRVVLFLLAFALLPLAAMAQEPNPDIPEVALMLGMTTALIGCLAFFVMKAIQPISSGNFDFTFWWSENNWNVIASVAVTIIVELSLAFAPGLVPQIFEFFGVIIETDINIGHFSLGLALATAVTGFVKRIRGQAMVRTDKQGKPLTDSKQQPLATVA